MSKVLSLNIDKKMCGMSNKFGYVRYFATLSAERLRQEKSKVRQVQQIQ